MESRFNQPAATASSGFRSITQKQNLPPFNRTNNAPKNEMSGGEVSATTTSNRGINSRRSEQTARKLPKFKARRHFAFLPKEKDRIRRMSMPFHCSRCGKRTSELS